jgi:hypothetical protein
MDITAIDFWQWHKPKNKLIYDNYRYNQKIYGDSEARVKEKNTLNSVTNIDFELIMPVSIQGDMLTLIIPKRVEQSFKEIDINTNSGIGFNFFKNTTINYFDTTEMVVMGKQFFLDNYELKNI